MTVPYTALARRFRPQTFAEVVGQGRIATTLRNAIHEGRVAHAYLFTGARGVGKTSMARIFAKALNCPNAVDSVPCNDCEICRGIAAGQDVDVSEIDGASNRGIDDIRALRANVNVRSMRTKYKVYIVDEVHMLTKEAFNALLKTLEEPPPGVKFVFCTTEPNKVPDTILSRCQRFDFGTIATEEIRGRLAQLADAEGFVVSDEALELVARRAAGSMRDSQSLFDQLLAFGSHEISADDVHRLLGTAPDERLVSIVQSLIDRQPAEALGLLEDAVSAGVQLDPFWDQLIGYARDLMVTATGATQLPLLSVGERQRPQLQHQAGDWGLQTILAALEIFAETKQRMQRSTFGRAFAELALVRIAQLRDLEQLQTLIATMRAEAAGERSGSVGPIGAMRPPVRELTRPASADPAQKKTAERGNELGSAVRSALGAAPDRGAVAPSISPAMSPRSTLAATAETTLPVSSATFAPPSFVDVQQALAAHSGVDPSMGGVGDVAEARGAAKNTGSGLEELEVPEEENAHAEAAASDLSPAILWSEGCAPAILKGLQTQFQDITGTYLRQVVSAAIVGPNQVEFSFPVRYDMGRRACERTEVLSQLESAIQSLTGVSARLRLRTQEGVAEAPVLRQAPPPVAASRHRTVEEPDDPLVAEIGKIFGVEAWRLQELGPVATAMVNDDVSESPPPEDDI